MGKTCERTAAEYAERFEPGLFDTEIKQKGSGKTVENIKRRS